MFKAVFFLVLMLGYYTAKADNYSANIQFQSAFSTGNNLPFWFTHNKLGKYPQNTKYLQLIDIEGKYTLKKTAESKVKLDIGANAIAGYGNKYQHHINQLYAKLYAYGWKLESGLFAEPEYFNNLSSSNGNIDRSNNNRPYPRIRLSTNEFIPFLFWKNWFRFKAEYDEGILNDERVVENTRLHHKSLYLKAIIKKKIHITLGLNHFVMWGGLSPIYGELPNSFSDYLTYITGGMGTSNFPLTDQLNVAGNQLGSYHLQIDFPVDHVGQFTVYINHPFEDHSGMEFDNRRDNLYGVFYDTKKHGFIGKIMYEHMYTIHQSGHIHKYGVMRGRDNYYNHGYYKTGFTYMGYSLSSPLFSPISEQSNAQAFENNRISMHHMAFEGTINEHIQWIGKFTWSKNLGTYNNPFESTKNQLSAIIGFDYQTEKIPFLISVQAAADYGKLYENRTGIMLLLKKSW